MSKRIKQARLHDEIYLKESRYDNPKDSFKFLIKILKKNIDPKKIYDVLDIGCANGELLFQLNKNFKNLKLGPLLIFLFYVNLVHMITISSIRYRFIVEWILIILASYSLNYFYVRIKK